MDTKLLFGFLVLCYAMPSDCLATKKDLKKFLKTDKIHQLRTIFEEIEKNAEAFSCLCDIVGEHGQHGGHGRGRGAATYVRWGRTICPGNHTELMYSGYAAGDWFQSGKGSAANYLCLPKNPDWAKYQDSSQSGQSAKIYGAEYETHSHTVGEALNNQYADYDVPCAVCQNIIHTSVYMIPGKIQCYKGWHLEYRGYLMSQRPGQSPSEYVCVDAHPETIESKSDSNGRLFYPVEAACGALPCPLYVANREITCAVCTR